jgi:transposase
MDVHKHSTQIERLEVVETGRRRRWSDEEKLRIVLESMETRRAISSTARRHGISRSLLMTWRRALRSEPMARDLQQQTGFAQAMVAAAEPAPAEPSAPATIDTDYNRRRLSRVFDDLSTQIGNEYVKRPVFLRRAPPCVMRHGCEDIGV